MTLCLIRLYLPGLQDMAGCASRAGAECERTSVAVARDRLAAYSNWQVLVNTSGGSGVEGMYGDGRPWGTTAAASAASRMQRHAMAVVAAGLALLGACCVS